MRWRHSRQCSHASLRAAVCQVGAGPRTSVGSDHAKTRDVDRDKRDRLCTSSTRKRSRRAREAIAFRALETRRLLMLASIIVN